VEPGTAAAVSGALAGAGLLIVGAAFATRRRQLGHP
jgi:MYXO-CTERM domain-containing protein